MWALTIAKTWSPSRSSNWSAAVAVCCCLRLQSLGGRGDSFPVSFFFFFFWGGGGTYFVFLKEGGMLKFT